MGWLWIFSLNVTIGVFLFAYLRLTLNRVLKRDDLLEKLRRQVDEIIIDLNGVTDRNLNLVEIKIESLVTLMEEVSRKVEAFDAKVRNGQSQKEERVADEVGLSSPVTLVRRGGKIAFGVDQILKSQSSLVLGNTPYRDEFDYDTLLKAEDTPSVTIREAGKKVISLFEQGISLEMIAKKLKMDLGEVELIVSLRTKAPKRLL